MSRYCTLTLITLVSTSGAAAPAAEPAKNVIKLSISIKDSDKPVRCALFASEAAWLKKPLKTAEAKAEKGKAECVFNDVAPGTYAISAYHDVNNNGVLDSNFVGIPREPTCVSIKADEGRSAPKFAEASFAYAGGEQTLTARLEE